MLSNSVISRVLVVELRAVAPPVTFLFIFLLTKGLWLARLVFLVL